MEAKRLQEVKRKIPKFNQVRKTLENKKAPKVNMELSYKNKDTDEITTVQTTFTPKTRFPPHQFEKLYEISTVEVMYFF